jgi:uncharacterized damage-inducible protein DinB
MKTIFQAFARYNRSVNQSILELVEPLNGCSPAWFG